MAIPHVRELPCRTDVTNNCTTVRHSNVWNANLRKCTMKFPHNLLRVVTPEEGIVAASSYSCALVHLQSDAEQLLRSIPLFIFGFKFPRLHYEPLPRSFSDHLRTPDLVLNCVIPHGTIVLLRSSGVNLPK